MMFSKIIALASLLIGPLVAIALQQEEINKTPGLDPSRKLQESSFRPSETPTPRPTPGSFQEETFRPSETPTSGPTPGPTFGPTPGPIEEKTTTLPEIEFDGPTDQPKEGDDGATIIVSFFEVEYSTTAAGTDGSEAAADALALSYNMLSFDDDFVRQIVSVTVLCVFEQDPSRMVRKNRRILADDDFGFSIIAYLEVTGTCNGCQSDSKYSNQITEDRNLIVAPNDDKDGDGKKKNQTTTKGEGKDAMNDRIPKKGKKKGGVGGKKKKLKKGDTEGLPSEEDILASYSEFIQESDDMDFGVIIDVLSIVELEENPTLFCEED